ncbi:surface protein P113-like [Brassica napus]|uniref:surface protein P113-like n=1 Tax=Brassica napus TaxID=3708 RepID=UPI0020796F06|nr:surface protein P113-like [Brassica napus]
MSSSLHDSPLHDSHLHDSLQLDSNKFCTTLRLPGRVYEAVEPPDNPKAIIHHSKIDYVEKVEVSTMIGLAEEYKHLVEATHSDDADFHSVVKLVQQGYKMRRSDWENGFVDMFVATEDIGQQRKTKDEDAEHGEDLNHSEDEEENKDEEEKTDAEENKDGEDKTDEEENKDEEYQKDKEHRKDKDHSMSNSEKLDKLIQMVRDLDKRVVVIQNVLGVKFNDGSPNKEHCENIASSGDRRSAKDYENEEDTIDEEANSGDKKSALDDENEEEICDEEAKSGTEHLREEENIFGEIFWGK